MIINDHGWLAQPNAGIKLTTEAHCDYKWTLSHHHGTRIHSVQEDGPQPVGDQVMVYNQIPQQAFIHRLSLARDLSHPQLYVSILSIWWDVVSKSLAAPYPGGQSHCQRAALLPGCCTVCRFPCTAARCSTVSPVCADTVQADSWGMDVRRLTIKSWYALKLTLERDEECFSWISFCIQLRACNKWISKLHNLNWRLFGRSMFKCSKMFKGSTHTHQKKNAYLKILLATCHHHNSPTWRLCLFLQQLGTKAAKKLQHSQAAPGACHLNQPLLGWTYGHLMIFTSISSNQRMNN